MFTVSLNQSVIPNAPVMCVWQALVNKLSWAQLHTGSAESFKNNSEESTWIGSVFPETWT